MHELIAIFYFKLSATLTFKENIHLKFRFAKPNSGYGYMYRESADFDPEQDLIGLHAEFTYHSDGSLLQKLIHPNNSHRTSYRNPFGKGVRLTPLSHINTWRGVIYLQIADYSHSPDVASSNEIEIPRNGSLFNGEPLDCIVYLGNAKHPSPRIISTAKTAQIVQPVVHREKDIVPGIDMILYLRRGKYYGQKTIVPGTDMQLLAKFNRIHVLQDAQRT